MDRLVLPNGTAELPAFFPDATRGAVRGADSEDLINCGVRGLVMNAYHLMTKPGASVIKAAGGLHRFTGWRGPVITDSGGFQVFSLIRENAGFGEIRANEIIFRRDGRKVIFTPEKCVQTQFAYGADIIMCLDYCTHPDDPYEIQKQSVDITIKWAKRCAGEYRKQLGIRKYGENDRPLLFAIIQGGGERELRGQCADALTGMGFDGYGFGGWPLDGKGRLMEDILAYTAGLMPEGSVKYAMGLGKPENIAACVKMGYRLFDCVIPTRDARHNRLYAFNEAYASAADVNPFEKNFYTNLYILDDIYRRDARPVSAVCDCHACRHYSRAYLRHLNAVGDSLGARLNTIHNLRFYTMLMRSFDGRL